MAGVKCSRRVWSTGLLCAAAMAAAGCRSPVVKQGELYRHRELGYGIGPPPGPDGYWSHASLTRTDLGFRGSGGETVSLSTRCGQPTAEPAILARHLRFGLSDYRLRRSGEVRVSGMPAWMQILEVSSGSASVGVKTVTLVLKECIFDFVLAARTRFEEAERAFDGWLETFRIGTENASGGGP
jgi:hypothetical protein